MRNEDAAVLAVGILGASFLLAANNAAEQGRDRAELGWAVLGWLLIVAAFVYAVLAVLVR